MMLSYYPVTFPRRGLLRPPGISFQTPFPPRRTQGDLKQVSIQHVMAKHIAIRHVMEKHIVTQHIMKKYIIIDSVMVKSIAFQRVMVSGVEL